MNHGTERQLLIELREIRMALQRIATLLDELAKVPDPETPKGGEPYGNDPSDGEQVP